MKQINNEQLENFIRDLIDKKITRIDLAKYLDTDLRTLHRAIMGVAETNPELYQEYVNKFPYTPKVRSDIDYEALIIDSMKDRKSLGETSVEYDVSVRTINRKINEIKRTNPYLVELYRVYADCLKRAIKLPEEIQEKIDLLDRRTVVIATTVESREKELRDTLKKFEEITAEGVSTDEAAKRMGYESYASIWKKYQELKRIETEKKAKQTSFKDSLKVVLGEPKESNTQIPDMVNSDLEQEEPDDDQK